MKRSRYGLLLLGACSGALVAAPGPNGTGNWMLTGAFAVTAATMGSGAEAMVFAASASVTSFAARGMALGLDVGLVGTSASATMFTVGPKLTAMPGGRDWPIYPVVSLGGQVAVASGSGTTHALWTGVEIAFGAVPMLGRRLGIPITVSIYPSYLGNGTATMVRAGFVAFRR